MSSKKSKKNEDTIEKDRKSQDDGVDVSEIHTANDWEHADLGDEKRKEKFLRLMGAKKRKDEHVVEKKNETGSTSKTDESNPEKKHCRSKEQNEEINRELEKQFTEGLQSKNMHHHQRHGGLGFQSESSESSDWRHESIQTKFVRAKETKDHSTKDDEPEKKKKSKT